MNITRQELLELRESGKTIKQLMKLADLKTPQAVEHQLMMAKRERANRDPANPINHVVVESATILPRLIRKTIELLYEDGKTVLEVTTISLSQEKEK